MVQRMRTWLKLRHAQIIMSARIRHPCVMPIDAVFVHDMYAYVAETARVEKGKFCQVIVLFTLACVQLCAITMDGRWGPLALAREAGAPGTV